MSNDILERAVQLAEQGDRAGARRLVSGYLRDHPRDAEAWGIMSQLVDDEARRRDCLRRALRFECVCAWRGLLFRIVSIPPRATKTTQGSYCCMGRAGRFVRTLRFLCGFLSANRLSSLLQKRSIR